MTIETLIQAPVDKDLPFVLGRNVEHHSEARGFVATPRGEVRLGNKVHRLYGGPLDQGNVGACTGFTGAHLMNMVPNHARGERLRTNADGLAIYRNNTAIDQFPGTYPPDDTGSSSDALGRTLIQRGDITRFDWAFSFDAYLKMLMEKPAAVGTWWHADMFYPDRNGFVRPTGGKVGGHEYVGVGIYDYRARTLAFLTSWGAWGKWGNGRFLMTFADFEALLADDGDAMFVDGRVEPRTSSLCATVRGWVTR